MSGVPAGRLSIDIVAEVARLQADMDKVRKLVRDASGDISRSAKAANDNLSGIGAGAGKNVVEFSREVARLKSALDPAWAATQRYKGEVQLLRKALAEGAITQQTYAQQMQIARSAMNGVTSASGAQRAGFQQLGFQIQDVAVQIAGGTSATRAFGQQLPQAIGAMAMMGREGGKFAAFMGGPWGAALGVAAAVLIPLIGNLFATADAADKVKASSRALGDIQGSLGALFDLTTGKMKDQTGAALALAKAQIILAQATARKNLADANRDIAKSGEIQTQFSGGFGGGLSFTKSRPIEGQVASQFRNGVIDANAAIDGLKRLRDAGRITEDRFAALATAYANAAVETRNLKDLGDGYASILTGKLAPGLREEAKAHRERKTGMTDAQRAMKQAIEEAERFAATLSDETARIGLTARAVKQLEIANAAAKAPTAALAAAIRDAGAAWEARSAAQARTDYDKNVLAPMDRELKLVGLTGAARERAGLLLEEETFKANLLAQGLTGVNGLWLEYYMRKMDIINAGDALEKERESAEALRKEMDRLNGELSNFLGSLGQIGGFGGTLSGLLGGIQTGDFSNLGPLGSIANIMLKPADYAKQAEIIGKRIESVFGIDGNFSKTLGKALQGAGVGIMASTAIFGQKGNNFGAAIGGALGQAAGESLTKGLSGFLGSAGGPLGSIVGGLLGGLVGSIFGKRPRGSGSVTNTGVTSSANDGGIRSGLDSFGLGVQQSVSKIAEALGGTVGDYSIGIGRYKDYYQVSSRAGDPYLGGTYYNRKSKDALYDGLDPEAAMRAAIAGAIADGAIQGVRAGTQALLKKGTDIEAQLAKALKFEGVFTELRQATDPLGYALDQITKRFDDLRKIFAEAGATTAEYAQLEQLLAIQRADAIEQARQDAVSKLADPLNLQIRLLELMGKSESALTASRLLELAGIKQSLQPLQAMIYTLEDAQAVIEKFAPLRDDLIKFRDELLGGSAAGSVSFLTQQFRATAAGAAMGNADDLAGLRGAATDYLAAAKDNASSSLDYQRAVSEVLASVDKGIFAADVQVDYQQAVIDAAKANTELMQQIGSNLAKIAEQTLRENTDTRKLIDQLVNDGFAVPIQTESV